jgi:hypothetical protein
MTLEGALSPTAATPLDRDEVLRALVPPERMPLDPPPLALTDLERVRRFVGGAPVEIDADPPPVGLLRVVDPAGRLLGIAEGRERRLWPRVVLVAP